MTGVCGCGCGQRTPVAIKTSARYGHVKGQPLRFLHGHNRRIEGAVTETPAPRDVYAERLLDISALLVGAVHDDGPDELLAHLAAALRLPTPSGVDPVVALVTVLAAQIDPDTTAEQRLAWVRAFDPLQPPGSLPVRASPRKETAA